MADPEVKIKVTANTTQAKTALGQFSGKLDEVVRGVTGFSLASIGTVGAITGVVNAVKRGVDEWQNYALSSKDASDSLGIATEDFTRLVQVADDARLSQEKLTTALQMMAKNGVAPSVENLAALADELKGMSVTERAAKLSELFGRNWKEIYKILKDGGQALKDNTEAVADGLVVTGKAADEAEEYFKAVDNLNDSLTELKNGALKDLIPMLTGIVNTTNGVTRANKEADQWWQKLVYALPGVGLAVQALDGRFYELRDANAAALETARQMPDTMNRASTAITDTGNAAAETADKINNDLANAFKSAQEAANSWKNGAGGDIAGQLEAAGLSGGDLNRALIALDKAMGTTEYSTKLQKDATQKLVDEFKRTGDISAFENSLQRLKNGGFIPLQESAVLARVRIQELYAELLKLDGQTSTAYVNVISGSGGGTMTNNNPNPVNIAGAGTIGGRASGGPVRQDTPYIVGEQGPELFVPGRSGAIVPNNQLNMGGITININGAGNPSAVANAVQLKLASYGRQYQGA
jgi:hypothetical protein